MECKFCTYNIRTVPTSNNYTVCIPNTLIEHTHHKLTLTNEICMYICVFDDTKHMLCVRIHNCTCFLHTCSQCITVSYISCIFQQLSKSTGAVLSFDGLLLIRETSVKDTKHIVIQKIGERQEYQLKFEVSIYNK